MVRSMTPLVFWQRLAMTAPPRGPTPPRRQMALFLQLYFRTSIAAGSLRLAASFFQASRALWSSVLARPGSLLIWLDTGFVPVNGCVAARDSLAGRSRISVPWFGGDGFPMHPRRSIDYWARFEREDAPVFHGEDEIAMLEGAGPMRDDEGRAPAREPFHG